MAELLLNRVQDSLNKLGVDPEKKYGLAYSGGPDSTFLLFALKKLGFKNIILIYINYMDSDMTKVEEEIVKKNSEATGYPLIAINIGEPIKEEDGNFEAIARDYRYKMFSKLHAKLKFEALFLAHQQDDLIITYLMQKARGGIVSHYGILNDTKIYNVRCLRPLLDISKEEIIGYLRFNKIEYYNDKTNDNTARTRNWFRETILPSIDRDGTIKSIEKANLENAKKLCKVKANNGSLTFYKEYYGLPEDIQKHLLYSLLSDYRNQTISEDFVLASLNLAFENLKKKNSTKTIDLKGGLVLFRNYDGFYIKPLKIPSFTAMKIQYSKIGESLNIKCQNQVIEINIASESDLKKLNLKKEDFPLLIRVSTKQDVFGTAIVNRSVEAFIKSQKVPQYLRKLYPVIENKDGKIICVPFFSDIKKGSSPISFLNFIL
jgi:tRNA(Ile)-lysidine synthetase-like protein